MDKLAIYERTLRHLASDGNESAEMALMLGQAADETVPAVDFNALKTKIADILATADANLVTALARNRGEWTSSTDTHIEYARANLRNALAALI